jgi:hypothetical protein
MTSGDSMTNKIILVFYLFINVFVFSQTSSVEQDFKEFNQYLKSFYDRDISKYYFPKNSFHEKDGLDAFVQGWYGSQIDILDGEILIDIQNKNVIRFTCLRTFHNPFSIKVTWDNSFNIVLEYSLADGAGGYRPGVVIKHSVKEISKNELNYLLNLISQQHFYDQETVVDDNGHDGSQWIIEINIDGRYKVVDRWTPRSGLNYSIGIYLIEISGEKIENLY